MSVLESPLDGARSPLRDRKTGRGVSLRPSSRSGIISIHQRSKVRYRDFLVLDIVLLRFVMVSESSDIFTRSCALRKAVRMGQHTWLMLATIGTELLVIIKWSKGRFPTPLPTYVWFAWLVGAAMLVLYPVGQVSSHATNFVSGRFPERLPCVLVPLVVWRAQRSPISAAALSQTKNQDSVIACFGVC
jgi:hypothetical protein